MSKKVVVTRPEHDDTTYYLSHWSQRAITKAEQSGIVVYDLYREKANKKKIEGILKDQNPELVICNGHGQEDMVSGHKNEPLLIAGVNDNLLKGKITYALSCKSGLVLGAESIKRGAKAYIGYTDDFIFFYEPKMITHPEKDKTAEIFLDPSTEVVTSLIKGSSVLESEEKAKKKFKQNMTKLLSSEASTEETSMARYVWWNMKNLISHGDKTATF